MSRSESEMLRDLLGVVRDAKLHTGQHAVIVAEVSAHLASLGGGKSLAIAAANPRPKPTPAPVVKESVVAAITPVVEPVSARPAETIFKPDFVKPEAFPSRVVIKPPTVKDEE